MHLHRCSKATVIQLHEKTDRTRKEWAKLCSIRWHRELRRTRDKEQVQKIIEKGNAAMQAETETAEPSSTRQIAILRSHSNVAQRDAFVLQTYDIPNSKEGQTSQSSHWHWHGRDWAAESEGHDGDASYEEGQTSQSSHWDWHGRDWGAESDDKGHDGHASGSGQTSHARHDYVSWDAEPCERLGPQPPMKIVAGGLELSEAEPIRQFWNDRLEDA